MPVTDFSTFDLQLFQYLAGLNPTALTIEGKPRAFFLHALDQQDAGPVFSVLRRYDGDMGVIPAPTLSFQVETLGASLGAMAQAELIRALLCDPSTKLPKRNILLADFRVIGFTDIGMPGLINRDEQKNWARVFFNFGAWINAR